MKEDFKEYEDFTRNGIQGRLTRGVVVSVRDPLYAGRVKVYIPTLHGGIQDIDDTDIEDLSTVQGTVQFTKTSLTRDTDLDMFPWAPIMGNNWGPTGDPIFGGKPNGLQSQQIFGVFNIPKIGTEVFIIFEDDNPNLPVVIGSVFHREELVGNLPLRAIELTPGTEAFPSQSISAEESDYENRVSNSYIVSSQKGYQLLISDIDQEQQIRLWGKTNLLSTPLVGTGPGSKYDLFSKAYPNFPSTASAPYAKRYSPDTSFPAITFGNLSSNPVFNPYVSLTEAEKATIKANTQASQPDPGSGPSNTVVTKRFPVTASFPIPTNDKAFRSTRPNGRLHMGIDLSVPVGTPLIAPIDCYPMYYLSSSNAGAILIVKGIDGFLHSFVHLTSVTSDIIRNISNGQYVYKKSGEILGATGGVRGINGDIVSIGSGHLHWEVIPYGSTLEVRTGKDAWDLRTARTGKVDSAYKGVIIPAYSCIDPQLWLKNMTESSEIVIPGSQVSQFNAISQATLGADYDKPIGLEMCLVPGIESVSLRHSSGTYINIDPDGNLKFYSVGDIQFHSNRSVIFNVLGGIFFKAFALYSKIESVIKMAAANGGEFLFTSNPLNFPNIFTSLESFRKKDMADALISSSDNIYYYLQTNGSGKSIAQATKDGYLTSLDTTKLPQRNTKITDYDDLLVNAHKTYISQNPNTDVSSLKDVLTVKYLKSLMLIESNGNENAINGSAVGLFQLQPIVYQQIKKSYPTPSDIANYMKKEVNIDLALQYIAYLVAQVVNDTKKAYAVKKQQFSFSLLTEEQKLDMVKTVFIYYKGGETIMRKAYISAIDIASVPSYFQLEQIYAQSENYKNNPTIGDQNLRYVPEILYIYKSI